MHFLRWIINVCRRIYKYRSLKINRFATIVTSVIIGSYKFAVLEVHSIIRPELFLEAKHTIQVQW